MMTFAFAAESATLTAMLAAAVEAQVAGNKWEAVRGVAFACRISRSEAQLVGALAIAEQVMRLQFPDFPEEWRTLSNVVGGLFDITDDTMTDSAPDYAQVGLHLCMAQAGRDTEHAVTVWMPYARNPVFRAWVLYGLVASLAHTRHRFSQGRVAQ